MVAIRIEAGGKILIFDKVSNREKTYAVLETRGQLDEYLAALAQAAWDRAWRPEEWWRLVTDRRIGDRRVVAPSRRIFTRRGGGPI